MWRVESDLIARARAGDGEAFQRLTAPHRRELLAHCYRMLGSLHDGEDAVQETLLAAWQGLDGFAGRASMRTWLYRIATNRCLNTLRTAKRRPAMVWNMPGIEPPEPTHLGDFAWLEPFPDLMWDGTNPDAAGPEARYEQHEAISLAFVTALQVLPPRQRAVLILRDVLGYHASEVAEMCASTVESVNSALKRARVALSRHQRATADQLPSPAPDSPAERALVAKFVHAYQNADVHALVELLTTDVRVSMPPVPLEYHGRDAVTRFYASVFHAARAYRLIPTRANGQPAFGAYLPSNDGIAHGAGFLVLTLSGDHISALTRFDNNLLPHCGLPQTLPH